MSWYPAPYYWGGGFWGAMAIGVTSAAVYGAIEDEETNVTYNSYEVQTGHARRDLFVVVPSHPDAMRTASGLVVVYGPENSVVCAQPNEYVGEGAYRLDTVTMDLIPINGPPKPSAATPPS